MQCFLSRVRHVIHSIDECAALSSPPKQQTPGLDLSLAVQGFAPNARSTGAASAFLPARTPHPCSPLLPGARPGRDNSASPPPKTADAVRPILSKDARAARVTCASPASARGPASLPGSPGKSLPAPGPGTFGGRAWLSPPASRAGPAVQGLTDLFLVDPQGKAGHLWGAV